MVVVFLSGINLSIFLPLNPAIYRIGNVPNILRPRCKKQDESQSPFYLLLQDFQNYSRRIWTMQSSSQSHDSIHLKILPKFLEVFLRHLYFSYCRRKAFNEAYDKINEFSDFKDYLASRFNKLEDTATELGSKNSFLRTWNSLLNYNRSLNMPFDWCLSLCNASE